MAITSFHSNRALTKTEVRIRDSGMNGMTMLLFEGIWKTLRLWTRKTVGYTTWDLMGHSPWNLEDRDVDNDIECWGLDQEVSEKNINK